MRATRSFGAQVGWVELLAVRSKDVRNAGCRLQSPAAATLTVILADRSVRFEDMQAGDLLAGWEKRMKVIQRGDC
jgi:hypothetical protein